MQQQLIKISQLQNNEGQIQGLPQNPRSLSKEDFEKTKRSLIEDPEMMELRELVAYDNHGQLVVILGNTRLRAMRAIGIIESPTKILPTNTPVEKLKAFVIKDNTTYGTWDYDELANIWDDCDLDGWGVRGANWESEPEKEPKEKKPLICPHCGKEIPN